MIGAYLVGVLTGAMILPVLVTLFQLWNWATDRNLEVDCDTCGRTFGSLEEPKTNTVITEIKFKWHRWTGACKEAEQQ